MRIPNFQKTARIVRTREMRIPKFQKTVRTVRTREMRIPKFLKTVRTVRTRDCKTVSEETGRTVRCWAEIATLAR